jgi:hypothetical protein
MSTIANAYRELDHYARQHYGITGDVLLAKLEKGESGGSGTAKSNAGARAWFQFMPGTRQSVVQKFGIDPWRSEHEARDAAVLHLTGKLGNAPGLEGYNPGGGKAYVRYILGQKVGHVAPSRIPGSAPSVGGVSGTGVNPTQPFSPGSGSQALAALLGAATGPQHTPPPVTLAPPPAFAASAAMPAGYQAPEAGAPPAPKPTIDPQQLQALTDLALPKIRQPTSGGGGGGVGGVSGQIPAGRRGTVRVAASANRAGVGLSGELTHFVSLVSGRARQPITITTGTNHNRLTVNGNVSDHWDGHAADIAVPVDSREGDHIASAALQAAGVSKARAMKLARSGGLFNVNYRGHRVQVIWKTYEGGNHHNHVHVGIR